MTTDLDAIRKLIEAADLKLPVQMDRRFDAELMCTTGTLIAGDGIAAVIHEEELALLIEAALNALPALLDELATERQQSAAMASITGEAIRQIGEERDAAREELARTRAELDHLRKVLDTASQTTAAAQQIVTAALADGTARINPATTAEPAVREVTLAEAAQQARLNLIEAEQRRIAQARIGAAATVEVWTNEDDES